MPIALSVYDNVAVDLHRTIPLIIIKSQAFVVWLHVLHNISQ